MIGEKARYGLHIRIPSVWEAKPTNLGYRPSLLILDPVRCRTDPKMHLWMLCGHLQGRVILLHYHPRFVGFASHTLGFLVCSLYKAVITFSYKLYIAFPQLYITFLQLIWFFSNLVEFVFLK